MTIVKMPDGTQVNFPDTMSETSIRGLIAQKFPKEVGAAGAAKPMAERDTTGHYAFDGKDIPGYNQATGNVSPGYASDVIASGAAGFGRGAADLVGLPGTISDVLQAGGDLALRKGYQAVTGEPPRPGTFFGGPTDEVKARMLSGNPLNGAHLKQVLSKVSGGATEYQPYTLPGEYARTGGEFLPGALAFGGAGAIPALTNAIIPAAVSETAGQLSRKYLPGAEPYVRILAALAGGYGANKLMGPEAAALPTASEIKASAGYADLKAPMQGAKVTKEAYQGIIDDLWSEASDFGLTTKLKGEVSGTLKDFAARAESGDASLYDLEVLRRSLRNIGGDKLDDASKALSAKLIDKLDNTVENLSESSIASAGDTGKPVLDVLKDARSTYRVGVKSQKIETAIETAKNAASGFENGLRVEFRKLLKPGTVENFTDGERKVIEQVARGTAGSNALRWFGTFGLPVDSGRNFLGSLAGGGVGSAIGSAVAGPVGAAIGGPMLMGAGTLAKMASNAATRDTATLAEALVKAGPDASRLFSEAMGQATVAGREALTRAVLQARSAGQVPMPKLPARQ